MNSSIQTFKDPRFIPATEELPEPNRPVLAVTPNFRCLAKLSQDGSWRYEPGGEKLEMVLAWSALLF
jgi:hypothetical protein